MTASALSTSTSWCPVVKLTGQSARERKLHWDTYLTIPCTDSPTDAVKPLP